MRVVEPIPSKLPKLRIVPSGKWRPFNWRELYEFRELLYYLTWRDVIIRYKQSVFGFAWVIIQPIINMVVFTIIFGNLAHLPSEGQPYALYLFSALLPWQLFSASLTRSGNSLVANSNLITKVYFPRLIIPLSSTIAGLVDFAMSFLVLVGLFAWFIIGKQWSFPCSWPLLTLPGFVLLALFTAFATGLWLSALNVRFRDVGYIIPFLIQIWMYLSPVLYSDRQLIPPGLMGMLYNLNPMVSVIQGCRWALLGTAPPALWQLGAACTYVLVIFISGMYLFTAAERTFADVI